jgi:hypothetical protein
MSTFVAGGTAYYGLSHLSGVTEITFDSEDLVIAEFATSQFDDSQIMTNVMITAQAGKTDIVKVAMNAFDGSFSIASWSFTNAPFSIAQIHVIGSSAADAITGNNTSQQIERFAGGPGADTMHGGAATTQFLYSNAGDIQPGEVLDGGLGTNSIIATNGFRYDFTGATISNVSILFFENDGTTATFTGGQMAPIASVNDESIIPARTRP